MATSTSASIPAPASGRHGLGKHGRGKAVAEFRAFWQQFFAKAFSPYRPELHYMRGPGPAWRAKHKAGSR
jgi:hypothetical protein